MDPQRLLISVSHFIEEKTGAQRGAGTCSRSPSNSRQSWGQNAVFPRSCHNPLRTLAPPARPLPPSLPPCARTAFGSSPVSRTIKGAGVLRQSVRRVTHTFQIICADHDLVSQVKGNLWDGERSRLGEKEGGRICGVRRSRAGPALLGAADSPPCSWPWPFGPPLFDPRAGPFWALGFSGIQTAALDLE